MGNRTRKSILNAEVELLFFFIGLGLAFLSRKIFLTNLGADFIGLTGTLLSILSLLNLSELGIGLSVSYFLFKPLATDNRHKINEIISLLGYLYKRIGQLILGIGIIVSLFFPIIFTSSELPLGIIYFAFFSFLGSNVIGYFINYKQILLSADQKKYMVSIYSQSLNILKSVSQIVLAIYYKDFYLWVAIEFFTALIQCGVLNWKINKEYPWLKTDKTQGRLLLKDYPDIIRKTKQIVIHQLKDFLLTKSDEIMIFAFVSLKMVAYYGNYVMIISKLSTLFLTFFSGMAAGIGNLVAEGDKKHIMNIFWQLSSVKYLTAGILVFSLSFLINPFIGWWLGTEYLLSPLLVSLFMINLYLMQTRPIVDMFNHSYGLYGDVWAAWTEGLINIVVTIAIAIKWGLIGILMGKIVSLFFIVVIWKPYYLFSQGFKEKVSSYWHGIFRYYICFGLSMAFLLITMNIFHNSPKPSLLSMFIFGVTEITPTIILYTVLLILISPGMKDFVKRFRFLPNIISLRKKNDLQ